MGALEDKGPIRRCEAVRAPRGGSFQRRLRVVLADIWRVIESLVWPVQCAGCGTWDLVLCQHCEALARTEPLDLVLDDREGVPAWPMLALGAYEMQLRGVVLAAKHEQSRNLDAFLRRAGRTLGWTAQRRNEWFPRYGSDASFSRVWVVPAPSSRSRQRARAEIVPMVAQGVAAGLRSGGVSGVEVVAVVALRPVRVRDWFGPRNQAGLGKRGRGAARAGSMTLTRAIPRGTLVLVVDDVCASGATLREVMRVVGPAAVGAVVLAASLRGIAGSETTVSPMGTP